MRDAERQRDGLIEEGTQWFTDRWTGKLMECKYFLHSYQFFINHLAIMNFSIVKLVSAKLSESIAILLFYNLECCHLQ